jgi:hypothetical protein
MLWQKMKLVIANKKFKNSWSKRLNENFKYYCEPIIFNILLLCKGVCQLFLEKCDFKSFLNKDKKQMH